MANGDNAENDNTLNATGGRLRVAAEEVVDDCHRVLFQPLADPTKSGLVVTADGERDARKPHSEAHG
jgi:hypothetical protein